MTKSVYWIDVRCPPAERKFNKEESLLSLLPARYIVSVMGKIVYVQLFRAAAKMKQAKEKNKNWKKEENWFSIWINVHI